MGLAILQIAKLQTVLEHAILKECPYAQKRNKKQKMQSNKNTNHESDGREYEK